MRRDIRAEALNVLLIIAGLLLATLGYRLYLIPNNVAPGGFTGAGPSRETSRTNSKERSGHERARAKRIHRA